MALFPSQICKKDLLENFNAISIDPSTLSSLHFHEPPCPACSKLNIPAEKCRYELQHNEPHPRLKSTEVEEYLSVAQYLSIKYADDEISKKRLYRRWKPFEKHTLLICLHLFQDDVLRISKILHRTEGQVKAYLQRLSKDEVINAKLGTIPPSPPGYYLPEELEAYFVEDMKTIVNSQLAPKRGAFGKLLRVATTSQEYSADDAPMNIKAYVLSNPPLSLPHVSHGPASSCDASLVVKAGGAAITQPLSLLPVNPMTTESPALVALPSLTASKIANLPVMPFPNDSDLRLQTVDLTQPDISLPQPTGEGRRKLHSHEVQGLLFIMRLHV